MTAKKPTYVIEAELDPAVWIAQNPDDFDTAYRSVVNLNAFVSLLREHAKVDLKVPSKIDIRKAPARYLIWYDQDNAGTVHKFWCSDALTVAESVQKAVGDNAQIEGTQHKSHPGLPPAPPAYLTVDEIDEAYTDRAAREIFPLVWIAMDQIERGTRADGLTFSWSITQYGFLLVVESTPASKRSIDQLVAQFDDSAPEYIRFLTGGTSAEDFNYDTDHLDFTLLYDSMNEIGARLLQQSATDSQREVMAEDMMAGVQLAGVRAASRIVLTRVAKSDPYLHSLMAIHYSQPGGFVGRSLIYIVSVDGTKYGAIAAGSATLHLPRDVEIEDLNTVVNNTFFHIEPHNGEYPMRNFAPAVVHAWEEQVLVDWPANYGDAVTRFETLVEPPRKGELYLRAGWKQMDRMTKGMTCKRVAGEEEGSYGGKRVWNTDPNCLRPKLVFAKDTEPEN